MPPIYETTRSMGISGLVMIVPPQSRYTTRAPCKKRACQREAKLEEGIRFLANYKMHDLRSSRRRDGQQLKTKRAIGVSCGYTPLHSASAESDIHALR